LKNSLKGLHSTLTLKIIEEKNIKVLIKKNCTFNFWLTHIIERFYYEKSTFVKRFEIDFHSFGIEDVRFQLEFIGDFEVIVKVKD
jgi:hypothetical protein